MTKDEMHASIVAERTGSSAMDIVGRLRVSAGTEDGDHGAMLLEAADEIERLRGQHGG